jgi:DNA-directed RNA polymerase alpha subunit/DNA-directed RNA polymerase subunit L
MSSAKNENTMSAAMRKHIQPSISNIAEDAVKGYSFTLSGVNVSLANSIRRTMLSSIPTYVFPVDVPGKCKIEINTSRLHNEIMKQRLGCIPIHRKVPSESRDKMPSATSEDTDDLAANYIMEVDVQNDTEHIMYVTTEHFRVKHTKTGEYIDASTIFPKNSITNSYIIFGRLRPKISDSIPGEHLKLTCEFDIGTAEDSSMYSAVSTSTYANTPDPVKADDVWEEHAAKLAAENTPKSDIEFQKKNFYLLDAQRFYLENSYDFMVKSVGVYEEREIVKMACAVLQGKFVDLIEQLDADEFTITTAESTMLNCYDLVLAHEDYTIGKVLEYILYERFFHGEQILSFCGFKKFHPHDPDSIIRIAYRNDTDKTMVRQHLRSACVDAQEFYTSVYRMF